MVTIVMATYNGEDYIEEQLLSIREQTYSEWRLLIRDDNSNDKTVDIITKFADQIEQEVIVNINIPGTGSAKQNFALLLEDAIESEYVMFCDQDDRWKKDKIERTVKSMMQLEHEYSPDIPLLVHGDVEVVNEEMSIVAESMFELSHIPKCSTLSQLIIQNNVTGCTMMINNVLLRAIAGTALREEVIMHDYLAALYVTVFGEERMIDKPLLSYRQHGDNSVGAKNNNNLLYLFKRLSDGRRHYKQAMETSRRQIAMFVNVYGDDMMSQGKIQEYNLMKNYAELNNKSHMARIRFYRQNHIWKQGTVRKLMQCIWG